MSPDHIWTTLKSACLLFRSRLQEVLCILTVLTSLLSILWVLALPHTMVNVITFTISRLTEHNFVKWLVDIQAHLHWSKLWKYTQKNVNVTAEEESKKMNKWKKAADLMTSTLSAKIKRKLTEKNFNNRYKMLTKTELPSAAWWRHSVHVSHLWVLHSLIWWQWVSFWLSHVCENSWRMHWFNQCSNEQW